MISRSEPLTAEELFEKVLASMNAGRYVPLPEDVHQSIRDACEEHVAIQGEPDVSFP